MIKPIHDKILLKEIKDSSNKENEFGVVTSVNNEDTRNNQRLIKCKVVAISDGFIDENGNQRTIDDRISVDSVVIIDKYSGSKINEDGEEYILAKQIEVFAIVN